MRYVVECALESFTLMKRLIVITARRYFPGSTIFFAVRSVAKSTTISLTKAESSISSADAKQGAWLESRDADAGVKFRCASLMDHKRITVELLIPGNFVRLARDVQAGMWTFPHRLRNVTHKTPQSIPISREYSPGQSGMFFALPAVGMQTSKRRELTSSYWDG